MIFDFAFFRVGLRPRSWGRNRQVFDLPLPHKVLFCFR
nr:MAG TPA: hypothetical protein [Caudoviricetes sp.]